MRDEWLFPVFVAIGFFVFALVLVEMPSIAPSVNWVTIQGDTLSVLPWIIGSGVALFTIAVILGKKS